MRKMKDSGVNWIGLIPVDWKIDNPKYHFTQRKDRAPQGMVQLTASQKYGVITQSEYVERTGANIVTVQKDFDILKLVCAGDFVIHMRSFQGGLEYSEKTGSISSAYVMLIPHKTIRVPRYYKWFFKSSNYVDALSSTSNLVRDGQAMRWANFIQLPITLPPEEEQNRIADYLDAKCAEIDALTADIQTQIDTLEQYKRSVITEAVTKGLEPDVEMKDSGIAWVGMIPAHWPLHPVYTYFGERKNKNRFGVEDMIIGYESNPVKQIVAIGRVSAEQDGEKLFFEKVEGLTSPIDYATLRGCPELERMEYFQNPQGSLFKLTRGEFDFIFDLIREENPAAQEASIDAYTKSDFLDEVYMTEKRYENLVAVLRNKKNIILQGAPGVGKTFAAKRLAWSMMGEKDDSRIEFVQFHQNYSYEDFMMGYKPVEDGFELKYGIFYRFCQRAANQPDKEFFFIIDEINRGNMSKIFGELLMLIEKDYRGTKATLAYNGLSFSVPKNLYIIGMMNTADRSLAMIDYALRRRFSFFEVEPGFDSEGFIHYQNGLNNETLNELINKVKDLNREITLDKSLGKGFCIGHSYFCGRDVCTEEWLHSIVDYDILPMLSEYWFDDANKLQRWENILQGVFQ